MGASTRQQSRTRKPQPSIGAKTKAIQKAEPRTLARQAQVPLVRIERQEVLESKSQQTGDSSRLSDRLVFLIAAFLVTVIIVVVRLGK
jgi:hypothetical protein